MEDSAIDFLVACRISVLEGQVVGTNFHYLLIRPAVQLKREITAAGQRYPLSSHGIYCSQFDCVLSWRDRPD